MAFSHIRDDLAARAAGSWLTFHVGGSHVHEGGTSGLTTRAIEAFREDIAKAKRFHALGEMSEAQYLELLDHRGGCACSWPTISAPCWRCTNPLTLTEADELGWLDDEVELPSWLQGEIRDTDRPGIAAMSAKQVQPPPKPSVSIDGVEFDSAELLEALQIIKARKPQAVSTPRGLLIVAGFDHRLGRWNEGV